VIDPGVVSSSLNARTAKVSKSAGASMVLV